MNLQILPVDIIVLDRLLDRYQRNIEGPASVSRLAESRITVVIEGVRRSR